MAWYIYPQSHRMTLRYVTARMGLKEGEERIQKERKLKCDHPLILLKKAADELSLCLDGTTKNQICWKTLEPNAS